VVPPALPKPLYENQRAKVFWDVPMYAESTEVRANRLVTRIMDNEAKKVLVPEMSFPRMGNRKQKDLGAQEAVPGYTIT